MADAPVSYKASDMNENIEKEIARLRAQALWGWEKESRNLGWMGLRDGMSILEVGSGPGFITAQLLALCPTSHVTCVEIDPDLSGRAAAYLHSQGLAGRYTIVEGDLMQMDFPADTFDFAVARLVFQHLADPAGALAAIYRVLKPGGTLSITDIDHGLGGIFEPEDPAAEEIGKKLMATRVQRGGNPYIGRRLWRMLAAAGYVNMDLEILPRHTDQLGAAALIPTEWDPGAYKTALDAGLLTAADVETMHQAFLRFDASPDQYVLLLGVMVSGQKPG